MRSLDGKVIIVTGAASGIGRASSALFVEKGARVVLADWDTAGAHKTIETIREAGGEAVFCETDVSRAVDVRGLVESTVKTFGRLDGMFNNAAVQTLGKLADTSEEDWDRVHAVNLKGVFLCCKYGILAMIRSGGGSIVNMASILGIVSDAELAAYSSAKGGVVTLTKAAALGYGPQGVRVNCVCPGDVDTPMVQDYFNKDPDPDRLRREVSNQYALQRISAPGEVAEVVAFLLSDASSFVTGTALVVDGGVTAKCY